MFEFLEFSIYFSRQNVFVAFKQILIKHLKIGDTALQRLKKLRKSASCSGYQRVYQHLSLTIPPFPQTGL